MHVARHASMKAPPKRKGKLSSPRLQTAASPCLNESPYEKVGKYLMYTVAGVQPVATSMKVYISSCRTNEFAVILDHHNSLLS